ncbi:DegT/DnrJ/EryC1/StrS family aminotransferase [Leptospira idonii]|uniref:DegT/DnrJ/EryC1/StrS family aminotransferase n=1 Tax=Leptospira idonii TaxID=1193500 RepID=A0A4R9LX59_9LEPT|nr:DegT/DnrJ/EryC1/StrS family aminotransferase [Leptospira idonii]TGN18252.1 DegT/DnrJ/EryC1/StrS family aminotransferase [Leptospira idonii]
MSKLVFNGGNTPAFNGKLVDYNPFGEEEKKAAIAVLESGNLSGFVATGDKRFYGGEKVREFESLFSARIGTKYAVSFNSATSGLVAAIGALKLSVGDEVIVPAQTMSASAACALAYSAIPVFADVEKETYCIDPKSLREKISEKTKAIVVVHLYGHPANMAEILSIAKEFNLKIIEDCSQAPTGYYKNQNVGTFGDIGIFSFNFHKHINCGEGGIAVVNDEELRERLCLIRNHGEVKGFQGDLSHTVGWNFRLTELQAAIAIEQTKKIDILVGTKQKQAQKLTSLLSGYKWLQTPVVLENCSHVYYDFPMRLNLEGTGLDLDKLRKITALENLPITDSYKPLYWFPIYQSQICYGKDHFPFNLLSEKNKNNYQKGSCPNAESLYEKECLTFEICSYALTDDILDCFPVMFDKITKEYF